MPSERYQPQSSDSQKLAKSSLAAMAGVLLSRFSGVFRTMIVNSHYGASVALDAFNTAFRFPNSLRDLFADGALSSAFIKVLVDARQKGHSEEQKLVSVIMGFFLTITLVLAVLLSFFAPAIMQMLGNEKFKLSGGLVLATALFEILSFYLPLTMLNAVAMAYLGVIGKTFLATNGTIFLSLGMVGGSIFLAPMCEHIHVHPIYGLTWGAMSGAICQVIYQFYPLFKQKLIPFPNFNFKQWLTYRPLHNTLLLMVPRALGQGAMTFALLINTAFALRLGQGAMTYITTAVTIIQVPIGLFGVANGFASLPILSKAFLERKYSSFEELFCESLETALWLSLLTTAAFSIFIVPFYHIIFEYGKINYSDNIQNSIAVCAYSFGIVFSAGSKVILNVFYALDKTRQIVFNAFAYLGASAILSSLLAPHFGILGLGISYGCCTGLDFLLNFLFARKLYKRYTQKKLLSIKYCNKIAFLIVMSVCTPIVGLSFIYLFWSLKTKLELKMVFFTLAAGGFLYATIALLLILFFGPKSLRKLIPFKGFPND